MSVPSWGSETSGSYLGLRSAFLETVHGPLLGSRHMAKTPNRMCPEELLVLRDRSLASMESGFSTGVEIVINRQLLYVYYMFSQN